MRIAMLGQKGIPARSGGVERHVEELATRLVAEGHEVVVYCRKNYTGKTQKTMRGVELRYLPSIPTKHLDAITHTFLATLDILFRKVDVVHYHGIGPSTMLLLLRLLKPRTPIVVTFHSQDYFQRKWGVLARWYLRLGEFIACRFPNKTIAISQILKQHARSTYQGDAEYIPYGAETQPLFSARAISAYGLKKGNYILALGRLVRHKGFHTLIEAYKTIQTNKKLVIVGGSVFTDDYVQELHGRAQGNTNIIFLGPKTGRVVQELYANAYLVAHPSESEGLSHVLLEALGHGKTVLASDIPEQREALEHLGFFFRNKSVTDCAAKLKFLLTHPELVGKKRSEAHTLITTKYNWDTIIKKTIAVYTDVLRQCRGDIAVHAMETSPQRS